MKNIFQYVVLPLFAFLLFTGCKKSPDLPPETQAGNFTIGFKVNGKIYSATGKGGLLANERVGYNIESIDSSIVIEASRIGGEDKFKLRLKMKCTNGIGTYLMTNNPYQGSFVPGDSPNPDDPLGLTSVYETTASYGGQVNVRFFNGQFIPYQPGTVLSGTFEMNGVNKEGKRIRITEGRFDIGN